MMASIHAEPMPAILTKAEEMDMSMRAPWAEAAASHCSPPGDVLAIGAKDNGSDGGV